MWYLFHGTDEFSMREALAALRAGGDFGYNQDVFPGAEAPLAALIATCETFPFLSEQRLVVLEGLPKKSGGAGGAGGAGSGAKKKGSAGSAGSAGKKGAAPGNDPKAFIAGLADYLPRLPETTVLVILGDEALEATHPLMQAARSAGADHVRQFTVPKGADLERWIDARARARDSSITTEAVKMLALYVGENLRQLASELEKLALYAGQGGTIDAKTVRLLTSATKQARIFDLTDALARRERAQALAILHELLENEETPVALTAFIGSQVRTLMLIKDLSERGLRPPQIAETAGLHPFVVNKTLPLVRRFSMSQLKSAYRATLSVDTALKRSRMPAELALDLLVIEFGEEARSV
jgi:DNA polymerase-3 subunit delta